VACPSADTRRQRAALLPLFMATSTRVVRGIINQSRGVYVN
jgi:hypothetical protein